MLAPPPVRVLVAERDAAVRARLSTILDEADGVELVGAVPDAAAARVTLRRRLPDVLLLDLRLSPPEEFPRRPAVVALATFDSDAGILRALRDGAAGFVLRSARGRDLVKVVRLAADGHLVLSPDATRRLVSAATRLSGPRDERLARVDGLSARETQVLVGVGAALTNAEIAGRLGLPEPVVRDCVTRVVRKLGCAHRTGAGLLAYERGLCRPGVPGPN
ncbi:DNA-binding response regulator, NarL/FixJ family, contains REC and HTH domains [Amycolatopsis tolypomycina]|uniref:DNA-binding response regulator, NarL/FixJ family, contains REC and HTH domains n=1 Tax=Amycolatopsis tolypomycina TaxID=208445 RepID=A0A1H4WS09_9PSEU|nr:response regulator transcription factor [Amycolatopsis tolypomycina]SEC96025.1 DNA-binding response regulator, NarL/FixJ family, contains REC and HTH domains [Amycolatopsis tolypomycina]